MKKGKKTRWLYKAAGMAVLLGAAFWCSNSGLLLWKPEVLTVLAESESGGSLSSVTEEAKIDVYKRQKRSSSDNCSKIIVTMNGVNSNK